MRSIEYLKRTYCLTEGRSKFISYIIENHQPFRDGPTVRGTCYLGHVTPTRFLYTHCEIMDEDMAAIRGAKAQLRNTTRRSLQQLPVESIRYQCA